MAQTLNDLIALVKPLVLPATSVTPTRLRRGAEVPITSTKFGGSPYAEAGESWTRCGGCGEGLSFIFQCNLTECRHERGRSSLFTFFYCRKCCSWGDIPEDLRDAWVVRRYTAPSGAKAVPLADASPSKLRVPACEVTLAAVSSVPDWEEAEDLDERVLPAAEVVDPEDPSEAYFEAANAVRGGEREERTQIGGYGSWIQGAAIPDCDACRKPMRLLAQIDSEDEAGLMWGDGGSIYLFECREHPEQVKMALQCC